MMSTLFRLVGWLSLLSSTLALSTTTARPLSPNQRALDAVNFPHTWVPAASVFELDPKRPTPLEFLGQHYVAYQGDTDWIVVDDACPHRLAPLSEGRVTVFENQTVLECAYHGWAFGADGTCARIPQADATIFKAAAANPRSRATTYPTRVEKNVLWIWPWSEDVLSVASDAWKHPETMVEGVLEHSSTYTRDLPYGWDTLLENIVDPSHVPWAHHGLQGKRSDAIALNMTTPSGVSDQGFSFDFADRTMGRRRQGTGIFRAPFVIQYAAEFETGSKPEETPPVFNLTTVMLPTKPGWSRIIIFGGQTRRADEGKPRAERRKKTLFAKVFSILPTWLLHQFSNRFLDSDLAFLHYQEQERQRRQVDVEGYFMPASADRCVAGLRKWVTTYAHIPSPLPPPMTDRNELFNRWRQHSDHCRHCRAAAQSIQVWRKRSYLALGAAILLSRFLMARLAAVAALVVLRTLAGLEPSLRVGDFKHYEND